MNMIRTLEVKVGPLADVAQIRALLCNMRDVRSILLRQPTTVEQANARFTLVNAMDQQVFSLRENEVLESQLLLMLLEAQNMHEGTTLLYEALRTQWPAEWDRAKSRVKWVYGKLRKRLSGTNHPLISPKGGFYGFEHMRLTGKTPQIVMAPKQ